MSETSTLEELSREALIARVRELEQLTADPAVGLHRLQHDLHVHQEELVVQNQELKETGEKLELSRNRYAELYDFAPVGYLSMDRHSVIERINLTAVKMLGIERANALRMPFTKFLPPDSKSILRRQVSICFTERTSVSAELQLTSGKYVQLDSVPFYDHEHGNTLVWTTLTDITQRKLDEQTIQQAHARVEALIESTDDAIWSVDLQHRMVIANQRYRDVCHDLIADPYQPHRSLNPEDEELRLWWRRYYMAACAGEIVHTERTVMLHGSKRSIDVAMNPIREGERITGAVIIARDSTAKYEYEQALEAAKEEAENHSRAKSSFLAHIAHEIRTPLNAIIGFASLIKMKNTDDSLVRYSNSIVENSRRLAETTSELLSLSRLEARQVKPNLQPLDVLLELERAIEQILSLAEEKKLPIELDCKYSHLMISSDPKYFRQIISNLLTNAIKFTNEGKITVAVSKRDTKTIEVNVIDTGIGISETHLPHIFDEFYQEPLETHDQNIGAGLGLPIVKKLCELMGADVSVVSQKGQGSEFKLGFPVV
jgi:PAS domain S-box-containing protein